MDQSMYSTLKYKWVENPGKGGIFPPSKSGDAGFNLACAESYEFPNGTVIKTRTGVCLELPPYTWGKIQVRSGYGEKGFFLASSGVIDNGYRGEICAPLIYLGSNEFYGVIAGSKLVQLTIMPLIVPPLQEVDWLTPTERGADGFGSTGI